MKRWQDFLDSLSTRGGKILVASLIFFVLIPVSIHVMHHDGDSQTTTVIVSTFTAFGGALLAMLSGNASRQQMQDRIDTTKAPAAVETQKVETINVTTPVPEAK